MIRIGIGQKIFVGFFILILLSASFVFISYSFLRVVDALSSSVAPLSREMEVLYQYQDVAKNLEAKLELYLIVRSEESREEVAAFLKRMNQLVASTTEGDNEHLKGIADVSLKLTGAVYTLLGFVENEPSTYNINRQMLIVYRLFDVFEKTRKRLQSERLKELRTNATQVTAAVDTLLDRFFVIEFSIVAVGFFVSFFLSKFITRNLLKLRKGTQEIALGNFQTRIALPSKDEIGDLAYSFNRMAEELQAKTVSKEYLDNIIRSMAEALIVVDEQLTITSVNDAVCQMLAYQQEELIGEPIKKICSCQNSQLSEEEFSQRVKEGSLMSHEMCFRTKDGRAIPVLMSISLMRDEQGRLRCIICTARDITERKLAEEKIKEAAEMKSKLTSTVSHELRTPMAAIKTGISIILDGLAGEINDEQKDILDTARKNVDRLARLINNVLDFQKLDAGKVKFNFADNDINEVARESYRAMRSLAEAKGLNFKLSLEENLVRIRFDRDKIIQVLSNLLNNAIKFTEKGSITVTTQRVPGGIRVAVSDTGIGITQEDIPKVFHSYEQIQRPGGKKQLGTGLGLAICKEIISRHEGSIWVESELGKGSTFYFILPL